MAAPLPVPFTANDALFSPMLDPQSNSFAAQRSSSLRSEARLTLPAVCNDRHFPVFRIDYLDRLQLRTFLKSELDVSRLNKVDKHLMYAGLERPCRPLHNQIILGRDIWVTEKADLHMLWEQSHIYIKPLPDFLLEHRTWEEHICQDRALYEDAMGFLLSYMWIVVHKSDLRVAHERGLIPTSISWEDWINFANVAMANIDCVDLAYINIRYRRGELRLDRLNWIYRLCSQTRKEGGFFRAYHFGYYTYGSFIDRNLTVMSTITIYIALALTAMQVGLGTQQLQNDRAFNAASYGFTVFSIITPLFVIVGILLVTIYLIIKNWIYTVKKKKNWPEKSLDNFKH